MRLRIFNRSDSSNYTEVFGGVKLRIEQLAYNNGHLAGEIVRQQSDNLPVIARETRPLEPNNTPLGHRAAFRFDDSLNILAIESNRQAASPFRLNALIKAKVDNHAGFVFDPCLTEDALRSLRAGTPRKMSMRFALPDDLTLIEGDNCDIVSNIEALREAIDGEVVTVEIGFGRGGSSEKVLSVDKIIGLFRFGQQNRSYVETMKVDVKEEVAPINLFGQQVVFSDEVMLTNDDVQANYEARKEVLRRAFESNMDELRRVYSSEPS